MIDTILFNFFSLFPNWFYSTILALGICYIIIKTITDILEKK